MSSDNSRALTARQRAVMERIDRRVPIKVIAQELGVSETRINQHIRALKNIYEAESLGDLVKRHREYVREREPKEQSEKSSENQNITKDLKGFSEAIYSKKQLPGLTVRGDQGVGDDPGQLVINDVMPLVDQAPWLRPGEPRVVPRVLDGENAVLFRLLAIIGIAFGVLAAVVLAVTAAVTITEVLDGRATVPEENNG